MLQKEYNFSMLKELYTKYNYTNNFIYLMEFLLNVLNLKNFMIQAAKIIGTGITDYPEFFITFLLVDLYLFIYLYYPLAHVSEEFKNRMVVRLSSCSHGMATIAACAICTNLAHHFSTIAKCTHS